VNDDVRLFHRLAPVVAALRGACSYAISNVVSPAAIPGSTVKTICAVQHVEADYLGLIEDHLEARSIGFRYSRPFVPGGRVPASADDYDALFLLGGGSLGVVSGPLLPSLGAELRLAGDFLKRGLPVVGIGLGAVILAIAAGGGAEEAPLRFEVGSARRADPLALGGQLPNPLPYAMYLRDRPVLPAAGQALALTAGGEPAVFQVGRGLGFLGHPGIKSAMVEDLVMASDDAPADIAAGLGELRRRQGEIADALTAMMVGLIAETGLMTP
jgi:GMP synthase-like glutamine amidotransferase